MNNAVKDVMTIRVVSVKRGTSFKEMATALRENRVSDADRRTVANLMLEHARGLLEGLGYGGPGGPVLDLGAGLDYGEAFVGNIGGRTP